MFFYKYFEWISQTYNLVLSSAKMDGNCFCDGAVYWT